MRQPNPQPPTHFEWLDVARGLAAFSVIFWHWQHLADILLPSDAARVANMQPFYSSTELLYRRGWLAVDIFFCISGFIFSQIYKDKIKLGAISTRDFFVNRISRLYPLHLATLLAVVALDAYYKQTTQHVPLSEANDLRHFVAQLFMASNWGIVRGHSFNLPVWSVSVEMLLYGVFYGCWALIGKARIRVPDLCIHLALIALGLVVFFKASPQLGRGLIGFFVGAIVSDLHDRHLANSPGKRPLVLATLCLCLLGSLALGYHLYAQTGSPPGDFSQRQFATPEGVLWSLVTAPLAVLVLSQVDRFASPGRARMLGDVSYSIYLLHLPLMLLAGAFLLHRADGYAISNSPWFFIGFFLVLGALGYLSKTFFENPIQDLIRRTWLRKRPVRA